MSERDGESELRTALYGLSAREFEHFLADLWTARGWDARATQQSGDDGLDIVATQNEYYPEKYLIQAKHGQEGKRIARSTVQQYSYLHHKDGVDEVLLVTTGSFTDGARESAKTANLKLIDGETLIKIIRDTAAEAQLREFGYGIETDETPDEDDDLGWSPDDDVPSGPKGEIEDYATLRDVYARLLKTLGGEHLSLQARLGTLLQLFRGDDNLHCLIIAQPADRTYELMQRVTELETISTAVNGTRVDEDVLFGRYTSLGEIFPGALRETDDGVVGFKQFEQFEDRHPMLVEPLEEDQFTISAGNFTETFEFSSSILATGEFEYGPLERYEPLFRQLPCDLRLYYGFDYTGIGAWEIHGFTIPSGYTDPSEDVPPIADTRVKQHIALANELDPEFTSESTELLRDVLKLAHQELSEGNDHKIIAPAQLSDSLVTLSRASARVRLSETVEMIDVEVGAIGIPDCLMSDDIDTIIETSLFSENDDEQPSESKREDVKSVEEIIRELEDQEIRGVSIDTILDRAEKFGSTRRHAEHEIEKLLQEGKIYESYTDHYKTP